MVDGKLYKNIYFPYSTKVRRGFSTSFIKGEVEGYYPATVEVNKQFNAVSAINLCFFPGWIVDLATGAIATTEQDYYILQFDKQ